MSVPEHPGTKLIKETCVCVPMEENDFESNFDFFHPSKLNCCCGFQELER